MYHSLNRLRRLRENGEDGFTLIELLVVVVIIGVLIAIAIPLYLNYQKGANDKAAQSDLRGAVSVLEQCNSDNGSYPTAVATTGGAPTGCTGQTIKLSKNTQLKYTPQTNGYMIVDTNSSGGGKYYCYNSTKGGSVSSVTATSLTGATC